MKKKKLTKKSVKKKEIQGRWWNIKKNTGRPITAKYNKIADWIIDPKGYFLIKVDKNNNLIRVGYCKIRNIKKKKIHEMICEIKGKTAIEIVNTLIKEGFISSLQHAADMGIELNKAEISLNYDLEYIQDKDLLINKNK